jgi:hypothetical protein
MRQKLAPFMIVAGVGLFIIGFSDNGGRARRGGPDYSVEAIGAMLAVGGLLWKR